MDCDEMASYLCLGFLSVLHVGDVIDAVVRERAAHCADEIPEFPGLFQAKPGNLACAGDKSKMI